LNSYQTLEQREVTQTVEQIQGQILNQYSVLSGKLSDWAIWDDSYHFVQDNNSAFQQANLVPSSMVSIGINFILYFNASGKYVN